MRTIDADALFAEFENADWYNNADRDEIAEQLVLQAPTIDAVSVVRCDECKYCKEKGTSDCPSGYGYLYCTQKKSIVYEDDYCSWGEKR